MVPSAWWLDAEGQRTKTTAVNPYRHATTLLTSTLGTKVSIETRARGDKGRIVIDYRQGRSHTLGGLVGATDAV